MLKRPSAGLHAKSQREVYCVHSCIPSPTTLSPVRGIPALTSPHQTHAAMFPALLASARPAATSTESQELIQPQHGAPDNKTGHQACPGNGRQELSENRENERERPESKGMDEETTTVTLETLRWKGSLVTVVNQLS